MRHAVSFLRQHIGQRSTLPIRILKIVHSNEVARDGAFEYLIYADHCDHSVRGILPPV